MLRAMEPAEFTCQTLPAMRPQLRIAVVTETYPPEVNGVAMTLGRLVDGLQVRNHQLQLIRPRQHADDQPQPTATLSEHLQRGIALPRYEGLKMGLPAKAALSRLWTVQRPDVVQIATEGPLGWSALAVANKLRLPVASDFHTNFHSYSSHYGFGLLRRAIVAYLRKFHNKAAVTLVPTAGIRRELLAAGYENLEVIGRGVDTTLFHPGRRSPALRARWGVSEDATVALYVGRLAAEKSLDLVFRAFDAMRAANPATRLVLVGDGPERALWQARRPDAVYCGTQIGEVLAEHYACGDVFLFPSLTETWGNVTIEAMASGLAVVAYDCAAAEEIIRHGENGLKAPPENEVAFIGQALSLARDRALQQRLGRAAAARAAQLSWDAIVDSYEQVLLRLALPQPARSPIPAGGPCPALPDREPAMQRTRLSLAAHHGLDRLAAREHAWLQRLNGARLPDWEVGVFRLASRLGDGVFWYALMLALIAWHGVGALPAVLHMVVAGLAGTLSYKWLKGAIERPRPFQACPTICCLTAPLDRFSFPSGHTLHAVVFSLVATAHYPALGWLVWPFTALVAASRLVLGLHYVSDVLAGALIGASIAALTLAL
jgi:glycosyltransferase involved in cell wall biosynthesis/membrane-associated phospholipid phosphatase